MLFPQHIMLFAQDRYFVSTTYYFVPITYYLSIIYLLYIKGSWLGTGTHICGWVKQALWEFMPFAFESTSNLASIFTITTRGSQEPLQVTWAMYLKLSHKSLCYTMFTVCPHLGSAPDLPNIILKWDHPWQGLVWQSLIPVG